MQHPPIFKAKIPKGTLLYRRAKDSKVYPSMFFGFDTDCTLTSKYPKLQIQLWRIKEDLVTNFLVSGIYEYSKKYESSISDFWGMFSQDDTLSNGQIKSNYNENREAFFNFLREDIGIKNWIMPLDSHTSMEFFTMSNNIANEVEFVEYLHVQRMKIHLKKSK